MLLWRMNLDLLTSSRWVIKYSITNDNITPRKFSCCCAAQFSWIPYSISDHDLWYFVPYFRPVPVLYLQLTFYMFLVLYFKPAAVLMVLSYAVTVLVTSLSLFFVWRLSHKKWRYKIISTYGLELQTKIGKKGNTANQFRVFLYT